jgi:hypothetical protein
MSDSGLASTQAEAQVEASRFFGDEPVQAWSPSNPWWPALLQRARLLGWVAACCCVLAAVIGGMVWAFFYHPPIETNMADDVVDNFENEAPVPPRPGLAQHTTPPSPTLNITRRGAEWHIEAFGVSRMQVAQRLSQVSGSPLSGDLAALAATQPVQLSWQGRGAASAWQAVLGHEVSFATQCSTRRCRVWIAGAGSAGTPPTPPTAMPGMVQPPMPANVEVAAAAPQSDSEDPRVAAHHD